MKKILSIRDLQLIKLRAEKFLSERSDYYKDIMVIVDTTFHLLKENSLLKEKLFDIEQSVSEEDRILNIIDAKLDLAMFSNDKKNFLEINKSINNKIWTIIIQEKFGQTPQQLLKRSEIRRNKAVKKIVHLHDEIKTISNKTNSLIKNIKVLSAMKMDNPEDLLKTREELDHLRTMIEDKIKRYNSVIHRATLTNLHKSFNDSLREAWDRYATCENRARNAELELFKLKKRASKKKSLLSLIYVRRKVKREKLINKPVYYRTL